MGEDKLSESEMSKLKQVLEDNDIDKAMTDLRDSIIGWGEGARGPEGISDNADPMANYDVNKENFKDIIFGRELMTGMKVDQGTKLAGNQTDFYASKKIGLGGPMQERQLRAVEAYNELRQPPLQLIESQLVMRAKPRY